MEEEIDGNSSATAPGVADAVRIIEADFNRLADTHLLRVPLPGAPHIALYLKDESHSSHKAPLPPSGAPPSGGGCLGVQHGRQVA